jgi:hypothetical protein
MLICWIRFIQNLGIVAANVLALGPLFNERARQLSHIEDANELIIRHSARSSIVSAKDTTLIIEGPRQVGYTPEPPSPRKIESRSGRPGHPQHHEHRRRISVQLSSAYATEPSATETPFNGILKTVEVEVVEEDITDSDQRSIGGQSIPDDDWQNVLRGGPPSRANSRASARDRESRAYLA